MEWQLILVALVIAGAIGYLARATWRTWRASRTGCGRGCGCSTKAPATTSLINTADLTARLRSRNRPK